MTRDEERSDVDSRAPGTRWAVRIFVVGAFALSLWLWGPRAVDVLAARYQQVTEKSPQVDLDQVGFVEKPQWLHGPLLLAVAEDLGPWLQDRIAILDEAACRQLKVDLQTSPWIREVRLTRTFPDRFRLAVDLRRPVLALRSGDGRPLCLLDREATALPFVEAGLPFVQLYPEGGSAAVRLSIGLAVQEPRVQAAVGIAIEWRDELAPAVPDCPSLLEVDTTNLGERWMRGRGYPEVRIKLKRADGEPVILGYGHPVDTDLPRVSVHTKAKVLNKILALHPQLRGLVAADLRLINRWADYLQPRGPGISDPDGPWSDLERIYNGWGNPVRERGR